MHAVTDVVLVFALILALTLTLASVACTVVARRHGGAAVRRERAAALLMGVSALDMVAPDSQVLHAVGWGAVLISAALMLLIPPVATGREAGGTGASGGSRRAELAWHAGSLLIMSAMWWAMAGGASVTSGSYGGDPAHAGHTAGVPLAWAVVAVAAVLAVVAVTTMPRCTAADSSRASAWRHPLMAVGMLFMAVPLHLA